MHVQLASASGFITSVGQVKEKQRIMAVRWTSADGGGFAEKGEQVIGDKVNAVLAFRSLLLSCSFVPLLYHSARWAEWSAP